MAAVVRAKPREVADTAAAIVQDAMDWLDKNHLTENDEFIDVPVPQIQGQIVEVVKILLERVQQRLVEQIADTHAPLVADETVECETGFQWPANEGTVVLTTNSTTATHTSPTYTGVMDDLLTVRPSFGCSASHQTANTRDTWIYPATSIWDSCAVKGLIIELISQLQKKALENDIAKHSSPFEQAISRSTTLKGEILALQSELDALSKWPPQIDTMRADEDQANEGHPDKVCDQVSDVVINACLTRDTKCKIAYETCVKDNMFMVPGEMTVAGKMDHKTVARGVVPNF